MSENLGMIKVEKKTGEEHFLNNREKEKFTLIEFWQWMASDLVSNATRGIFAEFIVAKALELVIDVRAEWDPYDLEYNGVKIEVKSGAYIQSWKQKKESSISLGIGKTKAWDAKTNKTSKTSERQSDVYVFCVLAHREQDTINPRDLDQWEFYIISTKRINDTLGGQKSITLPSLKRIFPEKKEGLKFDQIKPTFDKMIKEGSIKRR